MGQQDQQKRDWRFLNPDKRASGSEITPYVIGHLPGGSSVGHSVRLLVTTIMGLGPHTATTVYAVRLPRRHI
ncbi:hypothetical protein VTN77DRAFT_5423 [Rasamsonia byssochlamydoides]|uniref:uncharacterized protein n=1 Tax=Rasamsonia byssochlamydoides TaxID=89139 RepID=UPI0037427FEC